MLRKSNVAKLEISNFATFDLRSIFDYLTIRTSPPGEHAASDVPPYAPMLMRRPFGFGSFAWLGNTDPAQYLPPTISSLSASKTSLYFRLDFTFRILPNRDTSHPTCI